MTLRARLLAGVALIAAVLLAVGVSVSIVQHDYFVAQLDEQMKPLLPRAGQIINSFGARNSNRRPGRSMAGPLGAPTPLPDGAGPVSPVAPGTVNFGDVFVGILSTDDSFAATLPPVSDPELVPKIPTRIAIGVPFTTATSAGHSTTVRAIIVQAPRGERVLFALSSRRADSALRRLVLNLAIGGLVVLAVLAIVVWWVIRLGLRPIRQMTAAADAIVAGATSRRIAVVDNVTEAGRLGLALNVMIDSNEASQQQLRQFVADASHELRTPLTTLRGYTSLYDQRGLEAPGALDDAMRRINNEATRMARIVEELLLLAEMDEHEHVVREPVDLSLILRDLVADLRVVQPDRLVRDDIATNLVVFGDAHHLTQALAAIATNALRYTPVDSTIAVAAHVDDASGTLPNGSKSRVKIEIVDAGPGIESQHLPHLFERFYRGDAGRSRQMGGSGLGLAIVASIIERHGGRYGVNSEVGVGSSFWIELPTANL